MPELSSDEELDKKNRKIVKADRKELKLKA
jgi:hypothetical protein